MMKNRIRAKGEHDIHISLPVTLQGRIHHCGNIRATSHHRLYTPRLRSIRTESLPEKATENHSLHTDTRPFPVCPPLIGGGNGGSVKMGVA